MERTTAAVDSRGLLGPIVTVRYYLSWSRGLATSDNADGGVPRLASILSCDGRVREDDAGRVT